MNVSRFEMKSNECKKLLGIKVDCKVKFINYLDDIFKKASTKVNALFRVTSFISLVRKTILINYILRRNLFIVHLLLYFIAVR